MTQRDRDRLVVLKKAQKKLITQQQAAVDLNITARQVRRLLRALKREGDEAVLHKSRGRTSNRRLKSELRDEAVRILSQEVYRGFGPTLAGEYLKNRHGMGIGREALRLIMIGAGLWKAKKEKVGKVHQWRERRRSRGELVQWDTSEHDWLEGRGGKLYLIHMIDDATSELTARFVPSDSTEANMRLLWTYLERHGRPQAFYTDKASLFRTAPKTPRDEKALSRDEREPSPPTQIGRALAELGIVWIAAHSPQAKGRVERSFGTAQDRLVKGLRVAGAKTLDDANRYLDEAFLPWWNQHLKVAPANHTDAHRGLGAEHDLAASLSQVQMRQAGSDYTIRLEGKIYQIARESIRAGLRHANVRVEKRLDATVAVRFQAAYLSVTLCAPAEKSVAAARPEPLPEKPKAAKKNNHKPSQASRESLHRLFRKKGRAAILS